MNMDPVFPLGKMQTKKCSSPVLSSVGSALGMKILKEGKGGFLLFPEINIGY